MKTHIIVSILTILFLLGCSTRQENKDNIYYIIKHPITITQDTADTSPPPPPPPPKIYYGHHNFILLDTSTIFYHHKHIFYSCGTGVDFSKPPHIFLTPDSLVSINIKNLPNFLSKHIPDSMIQEDYVKASISSPSDTIRNRAFKIIKDYFKIKRIKMYAIRNWTEEENYTVTAKINNKKYNPDTIKWKVGFDIYFLPPIDTLAQE